MGISGRDYYRESSSYGGAWLDRMTPVVKYLIIANIAVFLLQIFVYREEAWDHQEMWRRHFPEVDRQLKEKEAEGPKAVEEFRKKHPEIDALLTEADEDNLFMPKQHLSIVQEWFELDTNKVVYEGQVWRLITHAFCHDREQIWHIVMNMLLLYWFGTTLESMYGSREFLLFYLTAAVVAALAFVGLDLRTGSSIPGIGASGAVMGVMMLYTMHFPYEELFLFWLIRIQMRWLMVLYLIWDLHPVLLALAGDRVFSNVAHAAHVGGLAFGYLYFRFQWRLEPLWEGLTWRLRKLSRSPRPRLRLAPETVPEAEPELDYDMERVDALLQKIYESGQASLTDEERTLLQQASERLKNRTS